MSLGKKSKILLCLGIVLLGSFFVAKKVLANEINPPIILDAYQIENNSDQTKIVVNGLTDFLTDSQVSVLIYINNDYYNLANVSQINKQFNSFLYESPWIKNKNNFEIMVVIRDNKTLSLSPPSLFKINSIKEFSEFKISRILVKNNSQILAENDKNNEILAKLPAPTLIGPNLNDAIGKVKPFILGLTSNNTFVHIYIDGVYNGKTKILNHPSGIANFAYRPFLNLDTGKHQIWTVAEDNGGRKSQKSNILEFIVEYPMPAPTILTPVKNIVNDEKSFISGLAKNDSLIKVFIDHKLENKFLVKNHESGTANFAYNSNKLLTRGSHFVYSTATDKRGKESKWSNILYFSKYEPKITATTSEEGLEEVNKNTSASITIEKIAKNGTSSKKIIKGVLEEKPMISAKDEKNDNFKLNLAIFIIFLIGIIIWMFLVNKELIKENKDKKDLDFKEKYQ